MAEVKVVVKNQVEGQNAIKQQAASWNSLKSTLGSLTGAFGLVAAGMAATWKIAEQGAELELVSTRFDKLSQSIGTTSAALINDLGAATGGMMSNAQMMESASQIISLGLADNQKDVVDLASLVSELGWDMQQVILTFANNSKMRLDALGLSVTDVEERAKALEAQGYDTDKAFDLAVIQAGQAKLELLGSAAGTTAGNMKVLKANIGDMMDAFKLNVSEGINPSIEAFNILFDVVANGGDIVRGIVDQNIEQAESVDDLIAQYKRLEAQLGLGSSFTGTSDDIRDSMEKVRQAIVDTSGSADEYTAALVEMGIASEWQVKNNKIAYAAEYEREKSARALRKEQEQLTKSLSDADRVLLQNVDSYHFVSVAGKSFSQTLADVNYHQEEAYEGMVNSTIVLENNRAAVAAGKEEYDRYREALRLTAEEQDRLAAAMGDYFTTAVEAYGTSDDIIANADAMNQALYDAADAAGASATELAMLGLATGQLTPEMAASALQAAAMQAKILELGEAIANGMDPQVALNHLETFRAGLEAQDFMVRVGIDTDLVSKDSGKIKDAVQPAIDDTKTGVEDLGLSFVSMQETATGQFTALSGSVITTKTSAFDPLYETVSNIKTSLVEMPSEVRIKVIYETVGTPPPGGATGGAVSGGVGAPAGAYATGGIVPGPVGQPQLAVVHGGEEVLTPEQRKQRGGVNITVNVNGASGNGHMIGRQVAAAVTEQLGRLS